MASYDAAAKVPVISKCGKIRKAFHSKMFTSKLTYMILFVYYIFSRIRLLCTHQGSQISCDLYIHIPYNLHLILCNLLVINSILILKLFLPDMQSLALFCISVYVYSRILLHVLIIYNT